MRGGAVGVLLGMGALALVAPVPATAVERDDDVRWAEVSAGDFHTVALDTGGRVFTWGGNARGQLGDGSTADSAEPVLVGGELAGRRVVDVDAGNEHTVVVDESGAVFTWGANEFGQLGDGTTTDSSVPVAVGGTMTGHVAASAQAGAAHTLALDESGTVLAWGWNLHGELGDGTTTDALLPVPVTGLSGREITRIATTYTHSVAVDTDGRAVAWGWNWFGQLGDGSTENSPVPVEVGGSLAGQVVVDVAAGYEHTVATDARGVVHTWGSDEFGQLGAGGSADRVLPAPVAALAGHDVRAVDASWAHTVSLDADGTVHAWGYGDSGQLGNGTLDTVPVPTPVDWSGVGSRVVTRLSTAMYHTITLDTEGRAFAWGDNDWGQLGDGTFVGSPVPVPSGVPGPFPGSRPGR